MKKILFVILLWIFTLPAFAENTILIVGDSISAGYGIEIESGWAALLQKRLKDSGDDYRVINSSFSGDTTSDGLARLPSLLKQYQPNITIIELGGNDGLRGLQISTIKHNLSEMINKIIEAKSKVLVLGVRMPPNYGLTYTQQFQQIYTDFAKQKILVVIPNFLNGIDDNPKLMQADGIHPNSQAQDKLLENIWVVLQSML